MSDTLTKRGQPIFQADAGDGRTAYVTLGQVDDWAAYTLGVFPGVPSAEKLLVYGMKMRQEEAVKLFPAMNPNQYRR
jgi:hypothetical protein